MNVVVAFDTTKTLAALRRVAAKMPAAATRAVNRSAGSGMTVLVRETAKDFGIKQRLVRERLHLRKATPSETPVATIVGSPKPLPAYAFAPSPKQPPSKGRGRGVSWRSHGRRVRDPQAFIARMPNGHVGIFKRVGKDHKSEGAWSKNLPIRELQSASVWYVAIKYAAEALARAQEQLTKNLKHELRFALSK